MLLAAAALMLSLASAARGHAICARRWRGRATGTNAIHYYVALGDSLAEGYQPNGDVGHGYADQFYCAPEVPVRRRRSAPRRFRGPPAGSHAQRERALTAVGCTYSIFLQIDRIRSRG